MKVPCHQKPLEYPARVSPRHCSSLGLAVDPLGAASGLVSGTKGEDDHGSDRAEDDVDNEEHCVGPGRQESADGRTDGDRQVQAITRRIPKPLNAFVFREHIS